MQSIIWLKTRNRKDVVERIMRIIRQRGFSVVDLTFRRSLDGENCYGRLVVEGRGDLKMLCRKVENLFDVECAMVESPVSAEQGLQVLQQKGE